MALDGSNEAFCCTEYCARDPCSFEGIQKGIQKNYLKSIFWERELQGKIIVVWNSLVATIQNPSGSSLAL